MIKKIGRPTNSVTHPTLTGKQVTPCNRKTEQRQRNCREVENLGKRKILAKMVSGICLMKETAAALFLFWFLLVFYQRKQLSGWS
jgi:hypothetical protein